MSEDNKTSGQRSLETAAQAASMMAVSFSQLLHSMALGVVEAQRGLDESAIRSAQEMARPQVAFGSFINPATNLPEPRYVSMMELGFTPTFYQFVDTILEVKLTLKVSGSEQVKGREQKLQVMVSPIDASYSSTFGFNMELASTFRTKLVPVPPPALFEERIRQLMQQPSGPVAHSANAAPRLEESKP